VAFNNHRDKHIFVVNTAAVAADLLFDISRLTSAVKVVFSHAVELILHFDIPVDVSVSYLFQVGLGNGLFTSWVCRIGE